MAIMAGMAMANMKSKMSSAPKGHYPEDGEDSKEEMNKAKNLSFWDTWKWRFVFLTGCALGVIFIGLSTGGDSLAILFAVFWALWAAIAMALNWNFAVTKSLAESAEKIEATYTKTKESVEVFKKNNEMYAKQNEQLQQSVVKLQETQGKIEKAAQLLQGEVADMKVIQGKIAEMNKQSFNTITQREGLAGKQRKIMLQQRLDGLDNAGEDVLNRVRAYFDDASGGDNSIESKEFGKLMKLINNIPALKASGFATLKFSDFSDEYDDDASKIEKFELTSKLRPLISKHFKECKVRVEAEAKKEEAEAKEQFAKLKRELEAGAAAAEKKEESKEPQMDI